MPYGLVTVFGGTGFLGRCIVEHLHTAGARVRVAVRHTTEGVPPQGGDIEVVYADIRDGATVAQAVRDSDAVVNAVGLYVPQGEAIFQAVHIDGAEKVARAAGGWDWMFGAHLRYRCRCGLSVPVRPLQGPR